MALVFDALDLIRTKWRMEYRLGSIGVLGDQFLQLRECLVLVIREPDLTRDVDHIVLDRLGNFDGVLVL